MKQDYGLIYSNKKYILLVWIVFSALQFAQTDIELNLLVRFGDILNTDSYRMVGLPGNSRFKVSELMNGQSTSDWIAFADDGTGKLTPHSPGIDDEFIFSTGKAYWVLSKENFRVQNLTAPAATLTGGKARIPLHSGWNMITNPFDTSTSWEAIKKLNNSNDKIYYFKDGRFTSNSIKFEPYLGYYFFNRFDKEYLEIPANVSSEIYKEATSFPDLISISLVDNDNVFAEYELYLSNDYPIEDNYSQYSPPLNFVSSAIFSQLSTNGKKEYFSGNIFYNNLPLTVPLSMFTNEIPLSISINNNNLGYNAKVVDEFGFDVEQIMPDGKVHNYFLVISNSELSNGTLIPEQFIVSNPYPNPFNPSTKIRVGVPEPVYMTLDIYNVQGKLVKEFKEEKYEAGFNDILINMTGNPSGIYFYRISSENKIHTSGKFILLK